jgi:hypothetical protein
MTNAIVSWAGRMFAIAVFFAAATPQAKAESKAILDDAVTPAWQLSGWTGTQTLQNQFVQSGESAVRTDAGTWGGAQLR